MSFSQKFWDVLLPVTSAFSLCLSRGPSTFCPLGKNQQASDDSTSISTIDSFYTPFPPPSLPFMRSRSFTDSSSSLDANISPSQSLLLQHRKRSSPRYLTHPFYVVFDEDVLHIIFSLMDPIALGRCARVCRLWWRLATSILWQRDALSIGMYPLLGYFDHYYLEAPSYRYKGRRVRLLSKPSSACWYRFQSRVGLCIRSLTISTHSLIASSDFVDLLNQSAPKLWLPRLQTLRIAVNQQASELDLAKKFMQYSVEYFHLEVWEPLPDVSRAWYVIRREDEIGLPRFRLDHPTPSPAPLTPFFDAIARTMPGITHMSFNMRDQSEMLRAWPALVELRASLKELNTLELPLRALTTTAVSSLASGSTLVNLVARDFPRRHGLAPSEPYESLLPVQDSIAPARPGAVARFRSLAVTGPPSHLHSFLHTNAPEKLTLLHLNLSATAVRADDINSLISGITKACPALQDLKLCPIVSADEHAPPIRPNLEMLEPLRRLHDLTSLEIVATHASQFTEDEFTQLVSSWRRLTCLVLDHPNITVSQPLEKAELSLNAAFRALAEYCPGMMKLSLYVSPRVGIPTFDTTIHGTNPQGVILPRLAEVVLYIGYPVADAAEVAFFLNQVRHACKVELHPTVCTVHDVTDSIRELVDWAKRSKELHRFIKNVHTVSAAIV